MAVEPDKKLQQTPIRLYWLATRPGFLGASLVTALLGTMAAVYQGFTLKIGLLVLTFIATALVHSAMNVLNDYYDELNGTDRRNQLRIFPFTGGSRFIQNGVLTAQQTLVFAVTLLIATAVLGIILAFYSSWSLLGIGLVGFILGWGYSAPPLCLNSRGLGEPTIALAFGMLTPLGAWVVQTQHLAWYPILISLPSALLVMNILYINQFPDCAADRESGKRHWVARLGLERAAWVYSGVVLGAASILLVLVLTHLLPWAALWSGVPLVLGVRAAFILHRTATRPQYLAPAIKLTIASMLLHALLLSAVLWLA